MMFAFPFNLNELISNYRVFIMGLAMISIILFHHSYVSLFDVVTRDAFTFLSLSGICIFLSIY